MVAAMIGSVQKQISAMFGDQESQSGRKGNLENRKDVKTVNALDDEEGNKTKGNEKRKEERKKENGEKRKKEMKRGKWEKNRICDAR